MLNYHILGPLEVTNDGVRLELTAPNQKTLLTTLLLDCNHPVPTQRLIDAIWGDHPPATARAQLHICVSKLRRSMASIGMPQVVKTLPPGYMARLAPHRLDLHLSEQLALAAQRAGVERRPWAASEKLTKALALWRGRPLMDITSSLLQAVATRLEERRIDMLEERIAYDFELNRHKQLVDELRSLVATHPLREQLQAQLMTALYHCGRQSEALETYRIARSHFVEQLGLEPGEGLQRLHQSMLNAEVLRPSATRLPPAIYKANISRKQRESMRTPSANQKIRHMRRIFDNSGAGSIRRQSYSFPLGITNSESNNF